MSYSAATFFLDYEGGSDTARANLAPTAYADNGSGAVRITCNSTAAYSNDAVFDVAGTTGSVYVGPWKVTIVDGTHVDLQGSTFSVNPASKGTLTPRGGSSKTDAWKTPTTGASTARTASLDHVRMMGSPAPTSLGINGTWSDASGNNNAFVAIVSSTNATPIVVTLSGANYTALGAGVGDTVNIINHATNTKANGVWKVSATNGSTTLTLQNLDGTNSVGNGIGGATGSIRKINNFFVSLASEVTKNIALQGNQGTKATGWVASANVTVTANTTTFKEGGEALQIAIAAGFTTGLAAYFPTGTLDLSAFQQLSYQVQQSVGTQAAAGDLQWKLCSDAVGAVPVDTLNWQVCSSGNWLAHTLDKGSALGSSIASIALYVVTDSGAQTFIVDDIIACKASSAADSLSLQSLISKNTGDEAWFAIQSINATRVMLENIVTTQPSGGTMHGYGGTTETVTTYKRETIKTPPGAALLALNQAGVTYSGGWDRTTMTSQSLETFFDGQTGVGNGITCGVSCSIEKLHTFKYAFGVRVTAGTLTPIGTFYTGSCNQANWSIASALGVICDPATVKLISSGSTSAIAFSGTDVYGLALPEVKATGSSSAAVANSVTGGIQNWNNKVGPITAKACAAAWSVQGQAQDYYVGAIVADRSSSSGVLHGIAGQMDATGPITYQSITSTNGSAYGVACEAAGAIILGGSTSGNASGGFGGTAASSTSKSPRGRIHAKNFTIGESTKVGNLTAGMGQEFFFENYGGTDGDHRIFRDGAGSTTVAGIVQQTTTVHGSATLGWKYSPTSALITETNPLERRVARIAVNAGSLFTFSRWFQRDSTNINMRLLIRAAQLEGIGAVDLTASLSAAINTWQQLTITCTPTKSGVINIHEQCWGGTSNNGFSSDSERSQA